MSCQNQSQVNGQCNQAQQCLPDIMSQVNRLSTLTEEAKKRKGNIMKCKLNEQQFRLFIVQCVLVNDAFTHISFL